MQAKMFLKLLVMSVLVTSLIQAKEYDLSRIGLKQIDSGHRVFVELDTGREVIFHGINAVVKGFPWVPSTDSFDIDTSLVEKDHRTLADLGINLYRLGTM